MARTRKPAPATEPVTMKTPDITPVQIAAVVGALAAVAAAAGLPVSDELQNSIIDLVKIMAPILLASDFGIRAFRSRIAVARIKEGAE